MPTEVLEEDRDVPGPLAQGHQADREGAEAVVEVGPQRTGLNGFVEIAVGRQDDGDVDGDLPGLPDRRHRMAFEHAQQVGLGPE